MTVINPADAVEARAAVEAAIKLHGPVYMRFGRFASPILYGEDYTFELGKGVLMAEGEDVTLVATGYMVHLALEAREMLARDGISARVINIHTVKPLDKALLSKAAKETGAIVTAEEHSIIGGLGSAVAEAVAESAPVPVRRVGVEDTYGRSGNVPALLEAYGLTASHIYEEAKKAVSMK
jgi:transketolase